jgi:hypothetical protein
MSDEMVGLVEATGVSHRHCRPLRSRRQDDDQDRCWRDCA